ncbi:MAG TPA: HAMP domain-containing sensor histidine kinase [Abditibacteriaceae bacterium]|nr:HAMP domain-containing sensor histidine kinase [Abditibacteriaceae bacterium]
MSESAQLLACARKLRFPDALERRFRHDYYADSIGLSRGALAASVVTFMVFGFIDPYLSPTAVNQIWLIRFGIVSPLCFVVVLLTILPYFQRMMQAALVSGLLMTGWGLLGMGILSRPDELGFELYPLGLLLVMIVGYTFLRLPFLSATISNWSLAAAYLPVALYYQNILSTPHGVPMLVANLFFIGGANLIGMTSSYALELYARRVFVANYLLDQERAGEQRKREKTEAMLKILSQAIGGVVHDLGNPLTSVQMGAKTLDMLLDSGETEPQTLKEMTEIISDGANMLDHLRLSLMEQTRVLEGKTIPVDLQPASLRRLVEAGIHFQKPRFANGRNLHLDGDDMEIIVDAMKLTSVFINLIGNALKYSDGEVHVVWHTDDKRLLLAVADQGRGGKGITRQQAEQLFVAFGRLDLHSEIEGTGLGLLSVRKIVEAHGGEVFIEGRGDETPDSPPFATSQGIYPSMLNDRLHTAFVVVLPLQPVASP